MTIAGLANVFMCSCIIICNYKNMYNNKKHFQLAANKIFNKKQTVYCSIKKTEYINIHYSHNIIINYSEVLCVRLIFLKSERFFIIIIINKVHILDTRS